MINFYSHKLSYAPLKYSKYKQNYILLRYLNARSAYLNLIITIINIKTNNAFKTIQHLKVHEPTIWTVAKHYNSASKCFFGNISRQGLSEAKSPRKNH